MWSHIKKLEMIVQVKISNKYSFKAPTGKTPQRVNCTGLTVGWVAISNFHYYWGLMLTKIYKSAKCNLKFSERTRYGRTDRRRTTVSRHELCWHSWAWLIKRNEIKIEERKLMKYKVDYWFRASDNMQTKLLRNLTDWLTDWLTKTNKHTKEINK